MPEICRFHGRVVAMMPKVVEAKYLGGYRVWLRFKDGLEGELDLQAELR
jgi:hypothetical protein